MLQCYCNMNDFMSVTLSHHKINIFKKDSAEVLELGIKTGEARALPASPLPTAL